MKYEIKTPDLTSKEKIIRYLMVALFLLAIGFIIIPSCRKKTDLEKYQDCMKEWRDDMSEQEKWDLLCKCSPDLKVQHQKCK